jgi:hypothetical protein
MQPCSTRTNIQMNCVLDFFSKKKQKFRNNAKKVFGGNFKLQTTRLYLQNDGQKPRHLISNWENKTKKR